MLVSLQISCGNHHDVKGLGVDQEVVAKAMVTDLTFLDVYGAVIEKNCKTCHKQYDNYEEVKKDSDKILEQVLTNQMPKFTSGLPQDLKDLVEEWIEAGSPEFGNAE